MGNDLANCQLKRDLTLDPNVIGFHWGRSNTTNGALPTRMAIQPANKVDAKKLQLFNAKSRLTNKGGDFSNTWDINQLAGFADLIIGLVGFDGCLVP